MSPKLPADFAAETDIFINKIIVFHYSMKVKVFALLALALLLSSCGNEEQQPQGKVYVVDGLGNEYAPQKPSAYVVVEDNQFTWLEGKEAAIDDLNSMRNSRYLADKEEEFHYEATYRNVRRFVDDEITIGYIKEIDNPEFKEVDE